ncbi:MAG TPA: hypothetical protein PKW90_06245 [Myxococcota bacterium]|nr:hypothetical protein [Myxococcota bacterium]
MTGEEVFNLLNKMAARGDSPRKRERQLRKIAEKVGLSSDALRAKARRFAKKVGNGYPLMRKPATHNREKEREDRRTTRSAWKDERIAKGKEALAKGADWAAMAVLFDIKTPEGAAQWWRRNVEGIQTPRRTGKARARKRSRAAKAPANAGS